MNKRERAIFEAEGKLFDTVWAMRMNNFAMAARYAIAAAALIQAIEEETIHRARLNDEHQEAAR
jgi:hypothetical protein